MSRFSLALAAALATALVGAWATTAPAADASRDATVVIEQYQVAFWGSGNLGGGTLTFEGRKYPFKIGGLGVGGFGVSKITATGEVSGLQKVEDFEGAYVQGRYGIAAADVSAGELFLENDKGVSMRLQARREGLALSLGGDAIFIKLD